MKKNFLAIASLLIVAMLLMVSCNQEVAPVDNGLVEARLLIDDSRKLAVGETSLASVTYKYRLDHVWTALKEGTSTQDIFGDTPVDQWIEIENGDSLGYVTQGLWTVSVKGYLNGKEVLNGSVKHYFNTQSDVVSVPVVPSTGKGTVNLTINMNDLEVGASDNVYSLSYSLVGLDGSPVSVPEGKIFTKAEGKDGENATYTVTDLSLDAGYYLLTVNVTEKESVESTPKIIGGSTITFLVINGGNVSITGYVEPNTFDKDTVDIDIIAAKPVLTLTDESNLKIGSDVVFGLSDRAEQTYNGYTNNATYEVYVDGIKLTDTTLYTVGESALTVKSPAFGAYPGPKTVTLVKKVVVTPFGQTPTTIMGSYQIDVTLEPKTN